MSFCFAGTFPLRPALAENRFDRGAEDFDWLQLQTNQFAQSSVSLIGCASGSTGENRFCFCLIGREAGLPAKPVLELVQSLSHVFSELLNSLMTNNN